MHIDWWTLGLQTVNLLVLVWILGRFLFRPVAGIIRDRQSAADEVMQKAQAERAKAEQEEKQAAQQQHEAAAARGKLLDAAAKDAEAEKAKLLDAARAEADKLLSAAKEEIHQQREAETAHSEEQAGKLAVDIASRLFERLPDSAKVDGFIAGLAEGVGKLPDAARAEIGAAGAPVKVMAARKMTAAEVKACQAALAKALGREVTVKSATDAGLIAGLEIETPHATVRNSFRADLELIAAGLTGDGKD
jgi:F-type H+-transporting ATPase subunit b